MRARPGGTAHRSAIAIRAAVVLGLCGLAVAATTPRAAAAAGNATLLVAPIDFFDTAADQRPAIVADQHRWLAAADTRLRHDLDAASNLHVVESKAARQGLAEITADYAHPTSCPSCLLAAAKTAGAAYAIAPELHRISNLILYMRVIVYRVGAAGPVFEQTNEVKADNRTMILRATNSMAQAIETAIPQSSP